MAKLVKSTWRRRRLWLLVLAALGAGFTGFRCSMKLEEGTKRHMRKQLNEASRMPGRLLT